MRFPVDNAVITSHYGNRVLNGKEEFHNGIDLVSRERNLVYSPFDGICSYDMDNYDEALRWIDKHHSAGNMVIIDYILKNVLYHMRFLHLKENLIKVGQQISEGSVIGQYADVGYSFGAHLHNDLYDKNWKKLNIEQFYKNLNLI
jgi:murein DD-endopeptidase MepM/ murein hydrolase activator NlpD